jgi:TniQ
MNRLIHPNLLVRPHPFRTEGPQGYLLRLAESNWLPVSEISKLGISYHPILLESNGLLPAEALDPDLHRVVANFSDLLTNRNRVWNKQARFCPHCLSEDLHWRAGWELNFYDACPQHGVWLIDQCSSCGDKVSWKRESLVRCQCGSDLRAEHTSNVPETVQVLSQVLSDKLLQVQRAYPAPLEALNVDQTQRLIRYLGAYMNPIPGRNPLKIKDVGLMSTSWMLTSLAAEILNAWPSGFHESIEKIQKDVDPSEARQITTVFGRAYHYLYSGLTDAAFNSVRAEFEKWISDSWRGGLAKRNRRLTTMMLANATWIPAKMAQESLGISNQRLRSLVRENIIEGENHVSKSGRNFLMVRRDQLDLARENLNGLIDMKTAGELLGLTKRRLRQILTKLFPEARKTGMSLSSPWQVSRFEIQRILELNLHLPRVSIPDEGDLSLEHILRYWAWTSDELGDLINAVRNEEFVVKQFLDGNSGITGWIFAERDLKAWQAMTSQGYGNWLTIPQLSLLLNIKQQVAYELVHKGFMESERLHRQPRGGIRVHRKEVEKFKERYIFCTAIAQVLGTSPRKAKAILADNHIYPVSGPGIDDSRQILYLRNDNIQRVLDSIEVSEEQVFDLI